VTWDTVPLRELVRPVSRKGPPEDCNTFTYVDLSSVDSVRKVITSPSEVVGSDAPSRARQNLHTGDVLVSTVRPNLNGVARVDAHLNDAIGSTGFAVLRADERRLDSRYLFQWVRTPRFVEAMSRLATGASYPAVTERMAKANRIPLPPLAEQRRIAAILDEADALRARCATTIELVESLAERLAIDLLGSSAVPTVPLAAIAAVTSGMTKGRRLPNTPVRPVAFMTVANVQDKSLNLSTVKYLDASEREIERYRLRRGDLLLTEGGDPDKLGRGVVWNDEVVESIHQNHLFRVRPDPSRVDSTWLNWEIGSPYGKRYFMRAAKQTTGIATINSTQLRAFPVRLMSRIDQTRFVDQISQVKLEASARTKQLRDLDALFASLQHRAFRGEL
jgi:type I restriction enzyme S subunit